jgi:hypothetical protein
VNPADAEAEITRLKDRRTALAYKAEQAVDMETGAIVAVTTHGGAVGDTDSIGETVAEAGKRQIPVMYRFRFSVWIAENSRFKIGFNKRRHTEYAEGSRLRPVETVRKSFLVEGARRISVESDRMET